MILQKLNMNSLSWGSLVLVGVLLLTIQGKICSDTIIYPVP